MRILVIVAAVLAALLLTVLVVGALVPETHIASRTIWVDASPPAVWKAITTVEEFPQWRDLQASAVVKPANGRRAWRETDRDGQQMTLIVLEEIAPRRLVTRIAEKNLGHGGTWTYELAPAGRGTQVTIIEDGRIDNPAFRCLARFVFGYHGTMDDYLEQLKQRVAKA